MNLNERRAEFVYNAARLAAIAAEAPVIPVPWHEREAAFREQFLEVIERECGPNRSADPERLHGTWMQAYFDMGWVFGETYDRDAEGASRPRALLRAGTARKGQGCGFRGALRHSPRLDLPTS